ncbi:MAG TPA: hypothetical protein PLN38_07530 [Chitinophagales bacterium]|nr:hypothetical protein [Chitinophagales bacterium]
MGEFDNENMMVIATQRPIVSGGVQYNPLKKNVSDKKDATIIELNDGSETQYWAADGDTKNGSLIDSGLNALSAILSKPKRELSSVEQKCGKRPLFGKRRSQWQDCANKANLSNPSNAPIPDIPAMMPEKQEVKSNKTMYFVIGGIALLGLVGFYLHTQKK